MNSKKTTFIPTAKENFWPMLKSELLQWRLNKTPIWNIPLRNWLLRRLIGSIDGSPFAVQLPLYVSFGNRTHIEMDVSFMFMAAWKSVIQRNEQTYLHRKRVCTCRLFLT